MSGRIPWRRGVAEVGVIVVGISIALGADALWSENVERRSEQEALGRLYQDFSTAAVALDSVKAEYQGRRQAVSEMLEVIVAGGAPPGSRQVPDSLLLGIYGTHTWNPPRGATQSLLSSGEISLVRSDSLRAELTRWLDLVDAVNGEEEADRRMYEQMQLPIVFRTVPYVSVVHRSWGDYANPSPIESDYEGLLTDLTFENVMEWRLVNMTEILAQYETASRTLERVMALLANELD